MKNPSYISDARKYFRESLANKTPSFQQHKSAIVQQRHADWPSPTQWAFGGSLIGARVLVALLPRKHVRISKMTYRDYREILLAEVYEISLEAFRSIAAFELVGGETVEGGIVSLEPSEPMVPESPRNSSHYRLFERLIGKKPPTFPYNNILFIRQLDPRFRFPSTWELGKTLKDAEKVASFLPAEHIEHQRLVVAGINLHLAHVACISAEATRALVAWHDCKHTTDVRIVMKKMHQTSKTNP